MSRLLHSCVAEHAQRRPDAPAVVLGRDARTYGQLDRLSDQVARMLRALGCRPGDRVALLMPKEPTTLACMLGVLKAGCVYVPVAPGSPAERVRKVLEACESRVLLASGSTAPLVGELLAVVNSAPAVGWMGAGVPSGDLFRPAFTLADVEALPAGGGEHRGRPEDPAHILFTSGSTGAPKGVVITHANVAAFVEWANAYFGVDASDRNSGHSPLQFDLSTYDIYGTLAAGASLYMVPAELNLLPHKMAEFIRGCELTQWFSVPSALTLMAKHDVVRPDDFPNLRRLLWCGEVLPTPALVYWMKRLPRVRFTNLYGPTEATIASAYYTVAACPADEKAPIPIGEACGGEGLLVLDEHLRPVPSGQTGDLYIRGVGLSPGYWRDPEKTAAVFLPNPHGPDPTDRIYRTGDLARVGDDGLVYFLGRNDTQIKCRGYRIELGEIESALSTIAQIHESAVVAIEADGFEGTTICCSYVPAPGVECTPADLTRALSRLIPSYMLPSRWLALAVLPKNGNGKVDRPRLRDQFRSLPPAARPAVPATH